MRYTTDLLRYHQMTACSGTKDASSDRILLIFLLASDLLRYHQMTACSGTKDAYADILLIFLLASCESTQNIMVIDTSRIPERRLSY